MKKTTVLIISIVLLSTFLIIISTVNNRLTTKWYDTPAEAIINNKNLQVKSVLKVIIQQDVAIVYFDNVNTTITSELAIREDKGWRHFSIVNSSVWHKILSDHTTIACFKVGDKYAIDISYPAFSENNNIPSDNLNSKFETFQIEREGVELNYWFAILDEFPMNYVLEIGDREIKR
ncbi:hypothetical protein CLOSTMETH_02585 [[Clostridium] methylpentosum DSM 5476]|uniref:Uncharacterized protein n=1 Tax=[Clostridium] methylpentosum DSM 5476 TaxID=537013 RepID=C0EFE3_9FIRM|nr:hypothetical protein CLOSTMETH_02585 [[Clostridium] methylpentosum DSM 5476]